jgi:hypothetical protein
MAEDDLETEYHLTPRGWVIGTSHFFGNTEKEIVPPADRVLTMVRRIYQRSGYSPEEKSWREKWRSRKVSDVDLAKLKSKFPLET